MSGLRRAVLLLVLCFWAVPSFAAFTPKEQPNVRHAAEAALAVGRAETQLAIAIRNGGNHTNQAKAAQSLIRVSRDVAAVFHGLVGGITARSTGQPMSRAEQLAEVWAYRNGALAESLETAGKAVLAAGLSDYELKQAASSLNRIEPLSYLDPYPAMRAGHTIPAVLGPHGDAASFQRNLFSATHYWRDWAQNWQTVFASMPGLSKEHFGDAFGAYARGVDFQIRAAAMGAGIPIGGNETYEAQLKLLDGTCRIHQLGEWLWTGPNNEGAPQAYKAAQLAMALVDPSVAKPPRGPIWAEYRRMQVRLAESWFASDKAIGEAFAFRNQPLKGTCGAG